jgi:hypothetical protein
MAGHVETAHERLKPRDGFHRRDRSKILFKDADSWSFLSGLEMSSLLFRIRRHQAGRAEDSIRGSGDVEVYNAN